MYRFALKPKWLLFHLLIVLLVVLMVYLAFWQLHRLQSRREFNDDVRSRSSIPVADFATVVGPGVEPDSIEWRTVSLSGTYLPDEQIVVVNRSQSGQAGSNVVTPLETSDGTVVLVNRGFVRYTGGADDAGDAPAPPQGDVTVIGRVRVSEERRLGGLTDPPGELDETQRIDLERLAPQLPAPLAPVYLDLIETTPAQPVPPVPVPEPELGEGPHLSYMLQWFFFAGCAIVGWVLALRRSARLRRDRQRVSEAVARTAAGSPSPTDDGPATAPN